MKSLIIKEMKLTASPISYFFILFSVMTFFPGYPILLSGFFCCFGVFQSFLSSRENNDTLYTLLLPVRKTDAVRARFAFAVMIQMMHFLLSFIFTMIRMTSLSEAGPYVKNAMMNANQLYLAFLLIVYLAFNFVFMAGFYKNAYNCGAPFIKFIITGFVIITIAETLHHLPGLNYLNDTDCMGNVKLWLIFFVSIIIYAVGTLLSMKLACRRFDKVDM